MIRYINKIKTAAIFLLLAVVFLNSNVSFAQYDSNKEQDVLVAYNTSFFYDLEDNTSWEFKNSKGQLLKSGTGNFESETLSEPGDYVLHLHAVYNPNSCDASTVERLNIKVSAVKLEFDFSTLKFSRKIKGGQPATGIVLTVDAMYSSYENTSAVYAQGVNTAGVDTNIIGKLKNGPVTLQQGVNTLEFALEGQAKTGSYIMFDFVDLNKEVQVYSLTQIIE